MTEAVLRAVHERMDRIVPTLPALGDELCKMQTGELNIQSKTTAMDLVTAADYHSETALKGFFQEHFPDDSILSEESGMTLGADSGRGGFQWVVDPLDGTVNFAHGLPLFAISIGLMHNDHPVAGIIYLPALKNMYTAVEGKGAFRDGKPVHVSDRPQLSRAMIVTGFPYRRDNIMEALVAGVRQILMHAGGLRRTGSAALDLAWLADGKFDASYELFLNPWDTCAGTVIAREAGAVLTDLDGNPYHPRMKSIAGSNGKFHIEFLTLLGAIDRTALQSL